ncbi:MAG: doubled CXXCH domain-containing protein [Candidatus Kentron sp. G]|nr:MAG: doubled CXXCH domain-containing protein [Candidatus Kentron sp. G]VFM99077.1 MAG: doubled CXXCH domain-containing protein [Candidatus Kentron sp. G]VFN00917.1 MAG: doubled CXXCH domain-containing protein [Candidatus Kentron sp. G]
MIRHITSIRTLVCFIAILIGAIVPVYVTHTAKSLASPVFHGLQGGGPAKTLPVTDCSVCHQNPGMRPAYVGSDGLYHDLYIDQRRFEQSRHYQAGKQACADCHRAAGYDVYPHREDDSVGCLDCHEAIIDKFQAITKNFRQSVHYDSGQAAFRCQACHSAHYMKKAQRMTLEEKNAMCIHCHGERYNPSGLSLLDQHRWHPQARLHLENTACIACHTQPVAGEEAFAFKHRILAKDTASRSCNDCHSADGKLTDYLIDIGENPLELTNEQLANHFYISGATGVSWLDTLGLLLLIATAIGVSLHGLARAGAALSRRKS